MSRKPLLFLLAGIAALAAVAALAGPEGSVRGGSRDRVAVLSAKDFNIKTLEGRVVLVGFWQSNCEQCPAYIDWLTQMQGRYLDAGLVVVAVNQDRETAAATPLLNKIHHKSQVVVDPTGKLAAQYQLEDMPSSFLYDRNLDLQDKFPGFVSDKTRPLEDAIVKLLAKKYKS